MKVKVYRIVGGQDKKGGFGAKHPNVRTASNVSHTYVGLISVLKTECYVHIDNE